jgi:hypothetical protein
MKYEQPFGVSDPNASYINGNPSTGTMGSIPPAASIENPQREIVNLLTLSGLTPTAADLTQLTKGVQSGRINAYADTGNPNSIIITPNPAVTGYWLGQYWRIKVANLNTGAVTINVNGVGPVPLIHGDLSPLIAWEINIGQIIDVVYDGAGNFQLLSGGPSTTQPMLTAPRSVYVNGATGSDTAYDGSQATISGTHGPFQTIQHALSVMTRYNLGGWSFNIYVADGTYTTTTQILFPTPNGSGTVNLIGNSANPANVLIYNTGSGSCFLAIKGGNYYAAGFSFRSTASAPGDAGNGIYIANGTTWGLGNCSFGLVNGSHILSGPSSAFFIAGNTTITGGSTGGFGAHLNATINGTVLVDTATPWNLTITAPVNLPDFVAATDGGQARPIYGTITGAGNVTGAKFVASSNGVIETQGRGVNYLPGTTAGALLTGGQYV